VRFRGEVGHDIDSRDQIRDKILVTNIAFDKSVPRAIKNRSKIVLRARVCEGVQRNHFDVIVFCKNVMDKVRSNKSRATRNENLHFLSVFSAPIYIQAEKLDELNEVELDYT
jgi:hypothetical protein